MTLDLRLGPLGRRRASPGLGAEGRDQWAAAHQPLLVEAVVAGPAAGEQAAGRGADRQAVVEAGGAEPDRRPRGEPRPRRGRGEEQRGGGTGGAGEGGARRGAALRLVPAGAGAEEVDPGDPGAAELGEGELSAEAGAGEGEPAAERGGEVVALGEELPGDLGEPALALLRPDPDVLRRAHSDLPTRWPSTIAFPARRGATQSPARSTTGAAAAAFSALYRSSSARPWAATTMLS